MFCSICRHPRQAEMIVDYASTCSLRATARRFGAGYRSLQRHLENCISVLMVEQEQKEYEREFAEVAELLRLYFQPPPKPYRRKSIIPKKVEFTWSRRAWAKKSGKGWKKPENAQNSGKRAVKCHGKIEKLSLHYSVKSLKSIG